MLPADPPPDPPVICPCGRLLRDPVSRARGLGPVCHRRLSGRTAPRVRKPAQASASQPIPGQDELPLNDQLDLWSP